jgi:hypothetical protein
MSERLRVSFSFGRLGFVAFPREEAAEVVVTTAS